MIGLRIDTDSPSSAVPFDIARESQFLISTPNNDIDDDIDIFNNDFLPVSSEFTDASNPLEKEHSFSVQPIIRSLSGSFSTGLVSQRIIHIINGDFSNDLFNGEGEELYSDGSLVYNGSFKNGKYDGYGTLYNNKAVFKNCSYSQLIYQGLFSDGHILGEGVLYFNSYCYHTIFPLLSMNCHLDNTIILAKLPDDENINVKKPFVSFSKSSDWSKPFKTAERAGYWVRYIGDVLLVRYPEKHITRKEEPQIFSESDSPILENVQPSLMIEIPQLRGTQTKRLSPMRTSLSGSTTPRGNSSMLQAMTPPRASASVSIPTTPRGSRLSSRGVITTPLHLSTIRSNSKNGSRPTSHGSIGGSRSVVQSMAPTPKARAFMSIFDDDLEHEKSAAQWKQDLNQFNFFFLPEGVGDEYMSANEKKYTGTFHRGVYHGEGLYRYYNGDSYTGCFKNGLMMGQGRYYEDARKLLYSGVFDKGVMTGPFHVVMSDGYPIYEGELKDGMMSGVGTVSDRHVNNIFYRGEFNKGCLLMDSVQILYNGSLIYDGSVLRNWQSHSEAELDSDYLWSHDKTYSPRSRSFSLFSSVLSFRKGMSPHEYDDAALNIDTQRSWVVGITNSIRVGVYKAVSLNFYAKLLECLCFIPHNQGRLFYFQSRRSSSPKTDSPRTGNQPSALFDMSSDGLIAVNQQTEASAEEPHVLYCGFFNKGEFSDVGTVFNITSDCSCIYTGNFNRNLFNGEGLLFDAYGCSYVGQFNAGLPCGDMQVFDQKRRLVYKGIVDEHLRLHDMGTFYFADGSWFCGVWDSNHLLSNNNVFYAVKRGEVAQLKWNGAISMTDTLRHYGENVCCLRGRGVYFYENGDSVNCSYDAKGHLTHDILRILSPKEETLYKGTLNDLMRCDGEGTLFLSQLNVDGIPKSNRSSPSLTPTPSPSDEEGSPAVDDSIVNLPWVNRSYLKLPFQRQFQKRHSRTLFRMSSLKSHAFKQIEFRGSFMNGELHGNGMYYADSSMTIQGKWEEGKLVYAGIYINRQLTYLGELSHGIRSGFGTIYENGKPYLMGYFHDSVLEGTGRHFDAVTGHLVYEGYFSQGKYQGSGTLFWKSGTRHIVGQFEFGQPHGYVEEYNEKGQLCFVGRYDGGDRYGMGRLYVNKHIYEGEFVMGQLCQESVKIWEMEGSLCDLQYVGPVHEVIVDGTTYYEPNDFIGDDKEDLLTNSCDCTLDTLQISDNPRRSLHQQSRLSLSMVLSDTEDVEDVNKENLQLVQSDSDSVTRLSHTLNHITRLTSKLVSKAYLSAQEKLPLDVLLRSSHSNTPSMSSDISETRSIRSSTSSAFDNQFFSAPGSSGLRVEERLLDATEETRSIMSSRSLLRDDEMSHSKSSKASRRSPLRNESSLDQVIRFIQTEGVEDEGIGEYEDGLEYGSELVELDETMSIQSTCVFFSVAEKIM